MNFHDAVSPVDAAWLRMDTETNPAVITSLIGLEGSIAPAAFEQLVSRLVAFPRFRQRIVQPTVGASVARWEDDPRFDPALHIHRAALPSPGGPAALAELVSDVVGTPLDRSRPLWQLYVVEGVEPPIGHGVALLFRAHHCLGDGEALVQTLLAVAGVDSDSASLDEAPEPAGLELRGLAERLGKDARALGKLLRLPFDERTPLTGEESRGKRVAWSRPFPVRQVKDAARSLGAKVNDVLMASVTAAVRAYLVRHAALREHLELHAIVPVLLAHPAAASGRGTANHFGLVFASLPLAVASPVGRVREMKRRMDAIKASPEAAVTFGILGAVGLAGRRVERAVVDLFSRKGSLLVTNVMGPPAPIALGGRVVESMTVWAPTAGHVSLGISLLSYAGSLRMAVAGDAALLPDPEQLVAAFEEDLAALVRLAAAEPAPAPGLAR